MGRLALASVFALSFGLTACFSSSDDKQLKDSSLPYTFTYPDGYERGTSLLDEQAGVKSNPQLSKNLVVLHNGSEPSASSISVQPMVYATTPGTYSVAPVVKTLGEGQVVSKRTYKMSGYDVETAETSVGNGGASLSVIENGQVQFIVRCEWAKSDDRLGALTACQKVLSTFRIKAGAT